MFPAERGAALTVADALIAFQSYVENARVEFSSPQGTLSFEDLGRIVPRQQVAPVQFAIVDGRIVVDQRSPRSEEHTSELQSLMRISYAVFCLKKNKKRKI